MHPCDEAQVCTNISQKLAGLTTNMSENFIFKLHSHLRNVNDKAYEPRIIAIGPYHRDKDNVKMMEKHKLRYLQSLLKRKNEDIAVYVSAIGKMEQKARKCYAEPISLNATEFTEMLVLDGCFIIELLLKFATVLLREEYDPVFERDWMLTSLGNDLMLFENQIPFFILRELFDLIWNPNNVSTPSNQDSLICLALNFLRNHLFPGEDPRLSIGRSSNEIKHLLELICISWRPPLDMFDIDREREWRFISSVTELRNANVKFKRSKEEGSLFDIKFENGYLLLHQLTINDDTESFFRNLIAFEQYFGGDFHYVTDYVRFLDSLINSSADVKILCQHQIIDNWLGDDEVVSNMFLKLRDFITGSSEDFIYSKIFESVNAHCERRCNRWTAMLKLHHLNSPWAIISILAGIVLLLLTATQTVFSVHK